jgi:alanine racemase
MTAIRPVEADASAGAAYAVLEIDLGAIAANWRTLRAAHGGRPTAAVVKADAYGLGARRVVPRLYAEGCRHFFVAHLDEALAIRSLVPDAFLAVLNGPLPGTERVYRAHGIDPVLGSLGDIERWAAFARRSEAALPALVHVDTGMARLGLEAAEVRALAAAPERMAGILPRYVMTHLASADLPGDMSALDQLHRFAAACALLPPAPRSIANSAALFRGAAFRSELARPGVGLYGANPGFAENPVRPAVSLRAQVLQVRSVGVGEAVGYHATWRAARPSRIAILGVGYADGWPRALSNRGAAHFDGTTLPLVGRVSMDLSAYDVTDRPDIMPGEWLELIGPHCPLEAVAAAAGTSAYETLTSLGRRYARVWRG